MATASAVLCLFPVISAAQRADTAEIVAATLTSTVAGLRSDGDARLNGQFAFDPRIVHAERGRAPAGAPDSVMLVWTTQARDSTFTRGSVDQMLARGGGTDAWVTCGTEAGARRCTTIEFPLVVAVSLPWITGDRAQILVHVWYRSSFEEHPDAWFANVVWLHRVGNRWVADRMYNFGGT
jgi:hypothetical protein